VSGRWNEATVRFAALVPEDAIAADSWADAVAEKIVETLGPALAGLGVAPESVEVVDWDDRGPSDREPS